MLPVASPGKLLEMQIIGPPPRPTESDTHDTGQPLVFEQTLQVITMHKMLAKTPSGRLGRGQDKEYRGGEEERDGNKKDRREGREREKRKRSWGNREGTRDRKSERPEKKKEEWQRKEES